MRIDNLLSSMIHRNAVSKVCLIGAVVVLGQMAGCGQSPGGKGRGQAIAVVNSDELTIHQLNNEVAQLDIPEGKDYGEFVSDMKRLLVDRQLLVQQAKKMKTERRPEVMLAIARARSQILAKAYLERVMDTASEPSREEIASYYQEHPEFFSQRRKYDFLQLIIDESSDADGSDRLDEIRALLDKADAIEGFIAWLDELGVSYRIARQEQVAEEMQVPILQVLSKMEPGQTTKIEADDGIIVLRLFAAHPDKMSEEEAEPVISQILTDRKRKALATAELESLRGNATIKYFGNAGDKEAANGTGALP